MGSRPFHQLSEPGMSFHPCISIAQFDLPLSQKRMVSAGRGICASFVAGLSKHGEENRCQDRDNRDNNQQFDESEALAFHPSCLLLMR